MDYPYAPAAFINAIAEEGTKDEAVEWLQKTWNELYAVKYNGKGNCYLLSLRMNAWISKNGTGTSDIKEARKYTHDDAIDFCRLQKQADDTFGTVPIRCEDIEAMK